MSDKSISWTELREFRATELTKSFVLSWEQAGDTLKIDLDLSLAPEHAFYEKPRPSEGDCFRPALLEFPHCTAVAGANGALNIDQISHGQITGFQLVTDGVYALSGEFGDIEISSERPLLRLKGPVA